MGIHGIHGVPLTYTQRDVMYYYNGCSDVTRGRALKPGLTLQSSHANTCWFRGDSVRHRVYWLMCDVYDGGITTYQPR